MKIAVFGAGVIGVCSAWYLRALGHDVTVVERRAGAALETSFANGGQISASYAMPWANPQAPLQILKWLGREDAPLLFRWRADPAQWRWGLRFLTECLPARTRRNIAAILRLALFSRDALKALRIDTAIEYDQRSGGILHIYTDRAQLAAARAAAALLAEFGCDRVPKTPPEIVAIEPALAPLQARIVGGDFTPADESGDALLFTQRLATLCAARGVRFLYDTTLEHFVSVTDAIEGACVRHAGGAGDVVKADAYVVALGSYSPLLLRPLGLRPLIYPVKGYSVTIPVTDSAAAPSVSLTDDARKIVFSRLGARLRVAGTAELDGYNTAINPVRCEALMRRAAELFPDAGDFSRVERWAGLRPATPSNVPYVCGTRYRNLFLNTGHGTLGWTMACGSGHLLADLMSGTAPVLDPSPYALTR
ncbi:MAG TPA: D-amino acid dehydrogenase [Burkholderiales bacterium]|nr:D-amino acid dehydrogenase [Burkholderiales bacterium]